MDIGIKIDNVSFVADKLNKVSFQVVALADDLLHDCADHLLEAATNLAPVLTGDLRASGKVEKEEEKSDKITYTVTFSTPYAVRMHEAVYNLGPVSANAPGFDGEKVGRKYLERPLFKYKNQYQTKIEEGLEDILK